MGGCEPRIEVIVKKQNKKAEGGRVGGCEPRTEVIVQNAKNKCRGRGVRSGWGSGGCAVDQELKLY